MSIWNPVQDEILRLIPEPANSVDRNAVAVMKEGQVVGHVSFNLAPPTPHGLPTPQKPLCSTFL